MHKAGTRYMFTTEGHVVSVDRHLREAPWKEFFPDERGRAAGTSLRRPAAPDLKAANSSSNVSGCSRGPRACVRADGEKTPPTNCSGGPPEGQRGR